MTPLAPPPLLQPDFVPAARWNRQFRENVARDPNARGVQFALCRPDGTVIRHDCRVLSQNHPGASLNLRFVERTLKFMLWQRGASTVLVAGAPEIARHLAEIYRPGGARAFDHAFMGEKVYGESFRIQSVAPTDLPDARETQVNLGRNLAGCRIGFDLGGSDRKVAALQDGKVVFSEEVRWDPYFETDPAYHLAGIQDSLASAARHLPRVDAIGGSAAGVYVNNQVRVASLFRGVSPQKFESEVRGIFLRLREQWKVPFEVVNDGEVTALAGSMAIGEGAVLGISMGTSQAGGYVTPSGAITSWLNELAFAPIDYDKNAPADEWSGDIGCGVQYFSQQGVARLAALAGFSFPVELAVPERLVAIQTAMADRDPRAEKIFATLGTCFGHALAHYADFYALRHVLILGRVTSGEGGAIIIREAQNVLALEYPELAARLNLRTPDEHTKRHGQAVAAASLPVTR